MSQKRTPAISESSTLSVLESIPDAVVVADPETGDVVEANDAAGTLFDCEPTHLVGREYVDLYPGTNPAPYREALRRAVEQGRVSRLQDGSQLAAETAAGERVPVEINARQTDTDGRRLVVVFREIDGRLRRERRLRQASTRLETLLDALPLPVSVLDTDGSVTLWNQAAAETYGYPAETVLGEPYPLFVDDGEFDELLDRVTDGGVVDGYETTHRARDGSVLDVELYARPLYEDGELAGLIGASIDVTEQRQQSQRLDILHRVLRHNLRNRLAVIRGFANELVAAPGGPSAAAEQILDASDSLVDLAETAAETRKLVTRAQRRAESVSLAEMVATTETTVGLTDTTVTLADEAAGDPITVPRASESVLTWLLGYIHDETAQPALEIDVRAADRYVTLDICGSEQLVDDGARELIENDRETSLRHGSGLDIAQVYLVLTAAGGTISTSGESSPASTIHIELPRTDTT